MIFTSIAASAFTVFALGLRHGADPDHLAAIDNVTRNSYERTPALSRFAGTLFAGGHSIMVLAIAALVGFLGTRFTAHRDIIENAGTWISIVVLVALAISNSRRLLEGGTRVAGVKSRLLPRAVRESTNALLAIPIGLLFGFGFETSSQIATYTVAFSLEGGLWGALLVGAMFCLGMIVTDTLDSVLVHRLMSYRSNNLPAVMRVWLWSVTLLALVVAAFEIASFYGWRSPIGDLGVSAILVTVLLCVFVYVFAATRRSNAQATVLDAVPTLGEITR